MQRRIVRPFLTWIIVLGGLFASQVHAQAPSRKDEQAARESFERGRVYYDGGAFDQAAVAFEEAYRLSGRDALLYNLYLAHRDANQPQQAADALRGFLAKVPNIENRAQLEARLHALDQGLAREREEREQKEREERERAAAASTPAPVSAPVEAPATTPPTGRSKLFWSGIAVASAGGALMLASIVTGALANKKSSELEDGCQGRICDASFRSTRESGQRLARTTDALLFGGIAVAAAGGLMLFFDLRKSERKLAFDGGCSHTGCVAQARVRF
jgi:tetratricopeptide (TPR) repeat protein